MDDSSVDYFKDQIDHYKKRMTLSSADIIFSILRGYATASRVTDAEFGRVARNAIQAYEETK